MKSFSYTMMIVLVAVGMTAGLAAVAQGDTMIWGGYDGNGVYAFSTDGTINTPPSFTFADREAQGIALSPDGSILYVVAYDDNVVRTFNTTTGAPINPGFATGLSSCPRGLAVDSSGNLYVSKLDGFVDKFAPDGTPTTNWGGLAGAGAADVMIAGNYLYAGAIGAGFEGVAKYDLSNGARTMAMTGTRTDGIALGPDGTWYTTNAASGSRKLYSWDSSWGNQTEIRDFGAGECIDVDYFDGDLYVSCADTSLGIQKYDLGTSTWSTFHSGNKHRYTAMIPEPGTLVLLATGLIGLLCYAWRKRK